MSIKQKNKYLGKGFESVPQPLAEETGSPRPRRTLRAVLWSCACLWVFSRCPCCPGPLLSLSKCLNKDHQTELNNTATTNDGAFYPLIIFFVSFHYCLIWRINMNLIHHQLSVPSHKRWVVQRTCYNTLPGLKSIQMEQIICHKNNYGSCHNVD